MKAERRHGMFGFFECLKEQKSSLGRVRPFGEGAGQAGGQAGGGKKRERRKYMFAAPRTGRGGQRSAWRSTPQHVKRKHRASLRLHRQKQTGLNAGRVYSFYINKDSRNPF